jgi:hypothetical protein
MSTTDEIKKREGKQDPKTLDQGDLKKRVTRLAAKRKYWIEWECLFDKFPTAKQLESLHEELKKYIENYLNQLTLEKSHLATGKVVPKSLSQSENPSSKNVIYDMHEEIETFFSEMAGDLSKNPNQQKDSMNREALEFSEWDNGSWSNLNEDGYIDRVTFNEKKDEEKDIVGKKIPLKYTLYSRKWIDIFKHRWERVSDSHLVFSYQGWFETKNRVRLTEASEKTGAQ